MNNEILLLTKENRELFEPCIIPDIWQHMGDNDIFGYGIVQENNAVGAIVCSYVDEIVHILSLGVAPEYRRQGLARQLLAHLHEVCVLNSFSEIHVRYFLDEETRTLLEALLTGCGYSMIDGEFTQVTFALGDLAGSRVEKQLKKMQAEQSMKKLVPFGELTQAQQQWLLEQTSILWEERSRLSPTRSCANVRNGQIVGAVLISEAMGYLEITQLYSAAGEEATSMLCLFASMGEAYATLPPDTIVRFHAVDDITEDLIRKLLANCKMNIVCERIAYRSIPIAVTEDEEETPSDQ